MFAVSSSKSRAGRTRLSPPRVSPRLAASVSYDGGSDASFARTTERLLCSFPFPELYVLRSIGDLSSLLEFSTASQLLNGRPSTQRRSGTRTSLLEFSTRPGKRVFTARLDEIRLAPDCATCYVDPYFALRQRNLLPCRPWCGDVCPTLAPATPEVTAAGESRRFPIR